MKNLGGRIPTDGHLECPAIWLVHPWTKKNFENLGFILFRVVILVVIHPSSKNKMKGLNFKEVPSPHDLNLGKSNQIFSPSKHLQTPSSVPFQGMIRDETWRLGGNTTIHVVHEMLP